MIMNQISDSMLQTLLSGDMKKISEELTCETMNDDGIIIDYYGGDDCDDKIRFTDAYINIANFIHAHCTTSDTTDIMNRFLSKNERNVTPFSSKDDEEYWSKFDKVCKILKLERSKYIGTNTQYTYNYDNDLSKNIEFRILEDDYNTYYVLLEVHLGGDARSNFSDTVLLELNDIDYFYNHQITGWVRESNISYDSMYEIFEDTTKIENKCFYNKDGHEIILGACLEY